MSNTGSVTGTPISTLLDLDDRVCVISGFLRDVEGRAVSDSLTLRNLYTPIGLNPSTLILRERVTIHSDRLGRVWFQLLRGATVNVELPNRGMDHVLHCVVPDAPTADLIDFLFPHVLSVRFVTASPVELAVGESLVLDLEAVLSNGQTVPLTAASTTLVQADEDLLLHTEGFAFKALAPGATTISVSTFDAAPLGLLLQPDGTAVVLQDLPDVTLPSALVVNIS